MISHLIFLGFLLRAVHNDRKNLLRREFVFALGLILALTLSATQYENFVRPWNIHWYLCTSGMVAAFAFPITPCRSAPTW